MADGGEGEDEIQFLRTVSVFLVLVETNIPLVGNVCMCVRARARDVGRECTALRMTDVLQPSQWSGNPHSAHTRRGG